MVWRARGGRSSARHCFLPSKHRTRGSCSRADGARREVRGPRWVGWQGGTEDTPCGHRPRAPTLSLEYEIEYLSPSSIYQHLFNTYCVPGPVAFSLVRASEPLKIPKMKCHLQESVNIFHPHGVDILLRLRNYGQERGSTLPKVTQLKVAGPGPDRGLQFLCGAGPSQTPCLAWLPLCLQVLPDKL